MPASTEHASTKGALETALDNDTGGFRDHARTRARDAVAATTTGLQEAKRLYTKTQMEGVGYTVKDELRRDKRWVGEADTTLGTIRRAAQSGSQLVGVMLTITLAAAIGFVGTKVTSEIDASIDTTSGSKYDNASNSIASGFADAMGLTDIVFLVLMFGVILGALLAFRGRR